MTIEERNKKIQELRDEYKTATIPRKNAITLMGRALNVAQQIAQKKKKELF